MKKFPTRSGSSPEENFTLDLEDIEIDFNEDGFDSWDDDENWEDIELDISDGE